MKFEEFANMMIDLLNNYKDTARHLEEAQRKIEKMEKTIDCQNKIIRDLKDECRARKKVDVKLDKEDDPGEICEEVKEEHYKPGDIIVMKRLIPIGQVGPCGFAYTLDNYADRVDDKIANGMFFVEVIKPARINNSMEEVLRVDISNVIGKVIGYGRDTVTVKTFSDLSIPDEFEMLLKRLSKKEFDDRIRICHKMLAPYGASKLRKVSGITGCYLVDRYEDLGEGKYENHEGR